MIGTGEGKFGAESGEDGAPKGGGEFGIAVGYDGLRESV